MTMTRACRIAALAAMLVPADAKAVPQSADLARPAALPTIELTPERVVALGAFGDEASIEGARDSHSVVVLVNPYGEDCTLRFVVSVGESLVLRAGTEDGEQELCEFGLTAVVDRSTARFVYSCSRQPWSRDRKCSAAEQSQTPLR